MILITILLLPLLLVIPGFLLTDRIVPWTDRIERAALSVLLSLGLLYIVLSMSERFLGKFTPVRLVGAVVAIEFFALISGRRATSRQDLSARKLSSAPKRPGSCFKDGNSK